MIGHRAAPLSLLTLDAASGFLAPRFAGCTHEKMIAVHLRADLRALGCTVARGGPNSVTVPFRRIIFDALIVGADAMILAHNHPHERAKPSTWDKRTTRMLGDLLRPLQIRLVDHLIFAGDAIVSFRALGLL